MQQALISIIIPVYNLEKYISKCLDSLIAQTYKNLQIIVVNDGSKDKSVDILNEYAAKDSRIQIIDKINEGVSVARNIGIDLSRGEYILFVDGDDWIDDDMIEILYSKALKFNLDFIGGGFVFEEIVSGRKRYSPDGFPLQIMRGDQIIKNYLTGRYLWASVWGGLYNAKFIKRHNLFFDKNIHYGEDCFYNLQVMTKAENVAVCDNHFYHALVRASSVTRNVIHEIDQNVKKIDYESYFKSNGLWNKYKNYCKAWCTRISNYKLFHIALKVGYKDYISYCNQFYKSTHYKEMNTFKIRQLMNSKHHVMSLIGKIPTLTWLSMNLPKIFGKKILT